MTLSEFKAWFEGFTEGIEAAPTEAQFAKIKAKVARIDGAPITYPIYVERYRPWSISPLWIGDPIVSTGGTLSSLDAVGRNDGIGVCNFAQVDPASKGDSQTVAFDSHSAMRDLGRAEALN